jgi:guanylate kinase
MFDYVLVNENLDEATAQLVSIFRAEECRRERTARMAERLLAESRRMSGDKNP